MAAHEDFCGTAGIIWVGAALGGITGGDCKIGAEGFTHALDGTNSLADGEMPRRDDSMLVGLLFAE